MASGWSVSFRRRVRPLRADLVLAAERAAGRRVGCRKSPGYSGRIMPAYSRRRPGSITFRSWPGLKPREVRLSGLVWCHPSRTSKRIVKMTTMEPTTIANNIWLDRQAIDRATVMPSRSMPTPEYRSLAVHITRTRVTGRLTAGQSRALAPPLPPPPPPHDSTGSAGQDLAHPAGRRAGSCAPPRARWPAASRNHGNCHLADASLNWPSTSATPLKTGPTPKSNTRSLRARE